MKISSSVRVLAVVAVAALLFSGCGKSQLRKKAKGSDTASADASSTIPPVDVSEASLRGSEFVSAEGLAPIYFDYDSYSLKGQALETLKKNADYLKAQKNLEVLVAGYCDERGTVEYNLALGQKRAKEVREYYIRLGVPGKSVATISYGKESPFCAEHSESCWSQNRRGETRIRAATASNG
ncbi:MAG: OmpA family protein [Elusimicrobia bacterium]|nr:OmpA family protein [Elusimicrobiota bacterium]